MPARPEATVAARRFQRATPAEPRGRTADDRGDPADRPGSADASMGYRREARRLRGRFAGQSARLQQALSELARRHGAAPTTSPAHVSSVRVEVARVVTAPPPLAATAAVFAAPARVAARFADLVAARIAGPVLGWSERQTLLRTAGRMGIGRFDANLIIAAVQHRLPPPTPVDRTDTSGRAGPFVRTVAWVAMIEVALAVAVWCTWGG